MFVFEVVAQAQPVQAMQPVQPVQPAPPVAREVGRALGIVGGGGGDGTRHSILFMSEWQHSQKQLNSNLFKLHVLKVF